MGHRVARKWRDAGSPVTVVTRSEERAARLHAEGFEVRVGDIMQPERLGPLAGFTSVLYAVGFDRSSGLPMRDVYIKGLRGVLNRFAEPPERFLYVSSTGVYGDQLGRLDEQSPCRPTREGGEVSLAAEEVLAQHPVGRRRIVLRLAGIYGPGRLPRRAALLARRPIEAAPDGWLNLIHVDDVTQVVLAAEHRAEPPALYVVADGSPVPRVQYYEHAAALLGAPPPVFSTEPPTHARRGRSTGERRYDNRKMLEELSVCLRYPSYREGLASALAEEQQPPE